jgi:hypothetical protein
VEIAKNKSPRFVMRICALWNDGVGLKKEAKKDTSTSTKQKENLVFQKESNLFVRYHNGS